MTTGINQNSSYSNINQTQESQSDECPVCLDVIKFAGYRVETAEPFCVMDCCYQAIHDKCLMKYIKTNQENQAEQPCMSCQTPLINLTSRVITNNALTKKITDISKKTAANDDDVNHLKKIISAGGELEYPLPNSAKQLAKKAIADKNTPLIKLLNSVTQIADEIKEDISLACMTSLRTADFEQAQHLLEALLTTKQPAPFAEDSLHDQPGTSGLQKNALPQTNASTKTTNTQPDLHKLMKLAAKTNQLDVATWLIDLGVPIDRNTIEEGVRLAQQKNDKLQTVLWRSLEDAMKIPPKGHAKVLTQTPVNLAHSKITATSSGISPDDESELQTISDVCYALLISKSYNKLQKELERWVEPSNKPLARAHYKEFDTSKLIRLAIASNKPEIIAHLIDERQTPIKHQSIKKGLETAKKKPDDIQIALWQSLLDMNKETKMTGCETKEKLSFFPTLTTRIPESAQTMKTASNGQPEQIMPKEDYANIFNKAIQEKNIMFAYTLLIKETKKNKTVRPEYFIRFLTLAVAKEEPRLVHSLFMNININYDDIAEQLNIGLASASNKNQTAKIKLWQMIIDKFSPESRSRSKYLQGSSGGM